MEMILFTNKASKRKKERQTRKGWIHRDEAWRVRSTPSPSPLFEQTSHNKPIQQLTAQQLNNSTPQQLNTSTPQRLYFDSDTQMLPAIITTTTSDSSSAFLFPVISLYSVIPQMLDTIVGPQQMIGNEIVSPVYAFA